MNARMQKSSRDPAPVRRGRIFLSIFGVFLVLVAIYVGFDTDGAAEYAALGIG